MNKDDNERNAKGVDSLINFETVKYYGAEEYETGRYRDAVIRFQKSEWLSNASLAVLNIIQGKPHIGLQSFAHGFITQYFNSSVCWSYGDVVVHTALMNSILDRAR